VYVRRSVDVNLINYESIDDPDNAIRNATKSDEPTPFLPMDWTALGGLRWTEEKRLEKELAHRAQGRHPYPQPPTPIARTRQVIC
jgi:hypothetical protein